MFIANSLSRESECNLALISSFARATSRDFELNVLGISDGGVLGVEKKHPVPGRTRRRDERESAMPIRSVSAEQPFQLLAEGYLLVRNRVEQLAPVALLCLLRIHTSLELGLRVARSAVRSILFPLRAAL